jgi:hypothetical protein
LSKARGRRSHVRRSDVICSSLSSSLFTSPGASSRYAYVHTCVLGTMPRGQVFFALLAHDDAAGRDTKQRHFLELNFADSATPEDIVETVSAYVKEQGGRTAVSRRSSTLLAYCSRTKALHALPRGVQLLSDPIVADSLAMKGSVGMLIDDVRDGRGSFNVADASRAIPRSPHHHPQNGEQQQHAREQSVPPRTTTNGSWQQAADVRDEAADFEPGLDPEQTAHALLKAEMKALRRARQGFQYSTLVGLDSPHAPDAQAVAQGAGPRARRAGRVARRRDGGGGDVKSVRRSHTRRVQSRRVRHPRAGRGLP